MSGLLLALLLTHIPECLPLSGGLGDYGVA